MKQTRKGLGIGMGMGYKNLVPLDPYIHSLSAKGVKSIKDRLSKGDVVWVKPVAFVSGKVKVLEMGKDHMMVDDAGGKTLYPYASIQNIRTTSDFGFNAKGKSKTMMIDLEPMWTDLVRLWKNMGKEVGDELVYEEIQKMAKISDAIRQAQKEGKIFITMGKDSYIFDDIKELKDFLAGKKVKVTK